MTVLALVASLTLLAQDAHYFAPALHEQLACAPQLLPSTPIGGMRVLGNHQRDRTMFATGDGVIIDAGSMQGVKTGQQFFVRRVVNDQFLGLMPAELRPVSVHTAGWVRVVEVREHVAVAQVTHACDGILAGDYLEPYVDPADPPAAVEGAPDYDHPGRIIMGDERRQMGSAGTLMVLDRGTESDVRAGQTVTIFRETMGGLGPMYHVARATVVGVRPQSALLRIDNSREAVYVGDRVAINRVTK